MVFVVTHLPIASSASAANVVPPAMTPIVSVIFRRGAGWRESDTPSLLHFICPLAAGRFRMMGAA